MTRFTTFRLSYPLPGLLTRALAACSSHPEYASEESAVAVTSSGVTVDVVTTNSWQGGFSGAVRITDTAFASPITSFEIGFKLGGGAGVTGTPWNGNITAADASGNLTATNPDWLQSAPIQAGQTWDVGFIGSGTFTASIASGCPAAPDVRSYRPPASICPRS
jgi:mannan endo-1,4-beta-mannosidase